jgi:predicted O-methyltransferase YrrM
MQNSNNFRFPISYNAIRADSEALGFDMPSEASVGALLRTLTASKPFANCLELGTGTGLATCWLLDGLAEQGSVVTVDNDEQLLSIARQHLSTDKRVNIVCQDGDDFLREAVWNKDRYDLIFADTWSGKYRMLDEALSLLLPGGLYVIDDMLPQSNWPEGHADKVDALMVELTQRADLHVCVMDWSCGVVLGARRT